MIGLEDTVEHPGAGPPLPGGTGVSLASAAGVPAGAGVVAGVLAGFGGVWASGPSAATAWAANEARTTLASTRRSVRMAQQPTPTVATER